MLLFKSVAASNIPTNQPQGDNIIVHRKSARELEIRFSLDAIWNAVKNRYDRRAVSWPWCPFIWYGVWIQAKQVITPVRRCTVKCIKALLWKRKTNCYSISCEKKKFQLNNLYRMNLEEIKSMEWQKLPLSIAIKFYFKLKWKPQTKLSIPCLHLHSLTCLSHSQSSVCFIQALQKKRRKIVKKYFPIISNFLLFERLFSSSFFPLFK